MIHPTPEKLRALADRWTGQEARLQRIAEAVLLGEDWTPHLRGLPLVEEVPPRDGEAYGRDLRGANLKRFLHPAVEVLRAGERDAALIAAVSLEAMRNNTPLVWIIDPTDRTLDAYRPGQPSTHHAPGDIITAEPVLPGFRLDVAALFAVLGAAE